MRKTRATHTPVPHSWETALPHDSHAWGCTLAKKGTTANDDAFAFRRVRDRDRETWFLVVADGASTSPRGREAARLLAATLWKAASRVASASDARDALGGELIRAHERIRSRFNGSGLASVVAAAVFPHRDHVVHASVGDSLACIRDETLFRRMNEVDLVSRPRVMNSATVLVDGCPLLDRAVSQGVGIPGTIAPHLGDSTALLPGSIICLTSNGVCASHLREYLEAVHGEPTADSLSAFCLDEAREHGDDTTLLLLRVGREPAKSLLVTALREYRNASAAAREKTLRAAETSRWIPTPDLLAACEREEDEERRLRLTVLLERSSPRLTRTDAVRLLESAIAQRQNSVAMQLRRLIQTLRR